VTPEPLAKDPRNRLLSRGPRHRLEADMVPDQALARRIVREGGATAEERARYGLRLCLCRPPEPAQVHEVVELFQTELQRYRGRPEEAKALATDPLGALPEGMGAAELAAWTVVANVLLNLDGVLAKG
jgi:hypothetical protein